MDAELARGTGVASDRMLQWGMQRCPLIRDRCQNATGPTTNQAIANFSYKCDPFAGPGYFLLGDSAAFVDPIFSTGVCLAMMEARRAADHVKAILDKRLSPAAARRDYVRFVKRSTSIYFDMIRQFYRHSFRELFLNGTGPYQVHKAVLSVLAGHVFPKPKWRLVWRTWLFKRFIDMNTKRQLVPKRPTHSLLKAEPMPVGRIEAEEQHTPKLEILRAPLTASEPATAGVE
jgi:2-polyprenyl-6-methoxyphenol hydroxylase-like FAD-dependent oxidoreductase